MQVRHAAASIPIQSGFSHYTLYSLHSETRRFFYKIKPYCTPVIPSVLTGDCISCFHITTTVMQGGISYWVGPRFTATTVYDRPLLLRICFAHPPLSACDPSGRLHVLQYQVVVKRRHQSVAERRGELAAAGRRPQNVVVRSSSIKLRVVSDPATGRR